MENTKENRKVFIGLINERYELKVALENILKWSAHFPPAMNEDLEKAKELITKLNNELR
jgi:hypothetical protein